MVEVQIVRGEGRGRKGKNGKNGKNGMDLGEDFMLLNVVIL
jgi:hypothetical protein